MKRTILIVLVIALVTGLAAAGGGQEAGPGVGEGTGSQEARRYGGGRQNGAGYGARALPGAGFGGSDARFSDELGKLLADLDPGSLSDSEMSTLFLSTKRRNLRATSIWRFTRPGSIRSSRVLPGASNSIWTHCKAC